MRSKRVVMGFAALLILLFHFYIPFGSSGFETFIYRGAYIGVDLFFLVSGMSLGKRRIDKVLPFYLNRIKSTYVPFVVLALIAMIYKRWSIVRFLKVIGGVEFFQKGGGAFLWFLFGILIFYALVPVLSLAKERLPYISGVIALVLWAVLVGVLDHALHFTKIFILLNRFPIFLIGFYYTEIVECVRKLLAGSSRGVGGSADSGEQRNIADADRKNVKGEAAAFIVWCLILIAGAFLLAKTGIMPKLNKPIQEFYYICAIPLVIALYEVLTRLSDKGLKILYPLHFLGAVTLETYGLQMIFGYDIEKYLLKLIGINFVAFLLAVMILIAMAFAFSGLRSAVGKIITNIFKKER